MSVVSLCGQIYLNKYGHFFDLLAKEVALIKIFHKAYSKKLYTKKLFKKTQNIALFESEQRQLFLDSNIAQYPQV